mgnify:CR=1 FL=1
MSASAWKHSHLPRIRLFLASTTAGGGYGGVVIITPSDWDLPHASWYVVTRVVDTNSDHGTEEVEVGTFAGPSFRLGVDVGARSVAVYDIQVLPS